MDGIGVEDAAAPAASAGAAAPPSIGVTLVPDGLTAFALRALSARAATRTLDLQYYDWEEDVTGRLLAREVLRAADRGVQVRLLLDDLWVSRTERHDVEILTRHPCVEVRLYNPFQLRALGTFGDMIEMLYAGYRLNHRMHNKAWIVDGQLLIAGGRNVGDAYFSASSQFNFRDLDLALLDGPGPDEASDQVLSDQAPSDQALPDGRASGRAAAQALAIFERYWTSRRVRPVEHVAAKAHAPHDGGALDALRARLDRAAADPAAASYLARVCDLPPLPELLRAGRVCAEPDGVQVLADPPEKGLGRGNARPVLIGAIWEALRPARDEVLVISPYFVPRRRGARLLVRLARRGVRVSVLTNSLAATDVLAVHGGYARYRRRLLRAGVELHELKRSGHEGRSLFGSGQASLHTKAFAVDGELAFVGSLNLDPRSAFLNTEMGTFVRHPALARQLAAEFARLTDPARSWAVSLDGGRLAWRDRGADGQARTVRHEPGASLGRRVLARVLGWLPIEPQL